MTAAISVPSGVGLASAADPRVEFADSGVHHEQRGDIADVGISLSGTDTATLRIGSADERHLATVTVRDADGDGRATVRFNTYDGTFEATGEDALTVRERSNASVPVASGAYDLELWPGDATDGAVTSASRLTVAERSTDDLRTWAAPESVALSNRTEIRAAMVSGNLTPTDAVTRNDTLVLELRASGVEGALAAQNESNVTADFFGLVGSDAAELRIRQTNPGPEVRPANIHLAPDSTRVFADAGNDTYYLVAALPDVNVTDGYADGELSEGNEYEANFSLAGSSALASNGTESVAKRFDVVDSRDEVADATTAEPTTRSTTETSPTVSTTVSTTDAPMREATTAATDATEPPSPTDDEVPGFGVGTGVVALVGLLAVALLARRRRQ